MSERWGKARRIGDRRWALMEGGALLALGAWVGLYGLEGQWVEILVVLSLFWAVCGISAVMEVTLDPERWGEQGLKVVLSLSSTAVILTAVVAQMDLMAAAIFAGMQALVVGSLEAGQALFGPSWRRVVLGGINGAVGLLVLGALSIDIGLMGLGIASVMATGGLVLITGGLKQE